GRFSDQEKGEVGLRRSDAMRRNVHDQSPHATGRAVWRAGVLAATCLALVGGINLLRGAGEGPRPADARRGPSGKADLHGDPLPPGALARLGTVRLRHGSDMTFVAFGAGGKTLLTAGQDQTIRLWDLGTGKEIRRFDAPKPLA